MNHRYSQATHLCNRCHPLNRVLAALTALALFSGISSSASAQSRLAGLKAELKTAADAKPFAEEIKSFVKSQVAALTDDKNPTGQQRARDLLVRECSAGGVLPTTSFLDVYATALNDQLVPMAAPKVSVRTRLNAAITLARVAKNTNNAKLAPAATKFVQDPCIAISLWGIKASQSILPALATSGKRDPLSGAVVDAAKKHGSNGDLVEEAYRALALEQKLVNEQTAAALTPDLLRLFQSRAESYANTTPPRPDLERKGVNALTLKNLWDTKAGAAARPAIMQQLANLAMLNAQHAAARPDTERRDFVDTLKNIGEALIAISGRKEGADPNLAAAGKKLAELQTSMTEQDFVERATAAQDAIIAKYPGTKPAPKMSDSAVRPEPTVEEDADSPDDNALPTTAPTTAPKSTEPKSTEPKSPAPKPAAPKPAAPKPAAPAPPRGNK